MKRKILILVLIQIAYLNSKAQINVNQDLHNRYWTYRENFRKYFTVISKEPGGGLPFSRLQPFHKPGTK